jgi:hypothetical protein
VLLTIAALSFFVAILQWLASIAPIGGFFLSIMASAATIGFYFHIVASSARGDDELETPDISDAWEFFLPLLRYIATFAPVAVAMVWGAMSFFGFAADPRTGAGLPPGPFLLFAAWLLAWPLMTCIAAIGRSVWAVYDPRIWWETLSAMRLDYVAAVIFFYLLLLVQYVLVAPVLFQVVLSAPPILGPLVVTFVTLTFDALRARLLGELCRPYMD